MKRIDKSLMCAHDKVAVDNLENEIEKVYANLKMQRAKTDKVQGLANRLDKEIRELKEYNDLLNDILHSVFPIAAVHGYRESEETIKKRSELENKLKWKQ